MQASCIEGLYLFVKLSTFIEYNSRGEKLPRGGFLLYEPFGESHPNVA